jgi:hypothetical protein
MEEICNRIHRAILDEPDMTQLSITTQEIKDLSLKTMRDVANSWKGEKVSVQNDVAVRIAVKYLRHYWKILQSKSKSLTNVIQIRITDQIYTDRSQSTERDTYGHG